MKELTCWLNIIGVIAFVCLPGTKTCVRFHVVVAASNNQATSSNQGTL